jgi:hypothetical protein
VNAEEFLRDIVARLDEFGIDYMVVGSMASSYWGEVRSTRDLDIVLVLDLEVIERMIDSFDPEQYYFSRDDAVRALAAHDQFNVIEMRSGWKVDFVIRKPRSFSHTEFARRRTVDLFGWRVVVASPEDCILTKLEWARRGGSDRQLRDAAGIVATNRRELDWHYLREWAGQLGVLDLLDLIDAPDASVETTE